MKDEKHEIRLFSEHKLSERKYNTQQLKSKRNYSNQQKLPHLIPTTSQWERECVCVICMSKLVCEGYHKEKQAPDGCQVFLLAKTFREPTGCDNNTLLTPHTYTCTHTQTQTQRPGPHQHQVSSHFLKSRFMFFCLKALQLLLCWHKETKHWETHRFTKNTQTVKKSLKYFREMWNCEHFKYVIFHCNNCKNLNLWDLWSSGSADSVETTDQEHFQKSLNTDAIKFKVTSTVSQCKHLMLCALYCE